MAGVRRKPVVFIDGRLKELPEGDILDGVFQPTIGTDSGVDMTITTEDILIVYTAGITVTLLETTDPGVKPVEIKNESAGSIFVATTNGEAVDNQFDVLEILPRNNFKFVPNVTGSKYALL